MNHLYLLLGGNQGNTIEIFEQCRQLLQQKIGPIKMASSLYKTAAWGKTDQADFLNQALCIDSSLSAERVLDIILQIELEMGRLRLEHWGPRSLDIDILLMDELCIDSPRLKVPHPALAFRRFALVPLEEIAANCIHPILQQSITELLKACPDTLPVERLSIPTN